MSDNIKPALTRKQIEFAKREKAILLAAISLFDCPHWEQVSVEKISKKAEIGKGTIYKHFSCKEEIYAVIALDFSKRLMTTFKSRKLQPDVLSNLQDLIRIAFHAFIEAPAEARVNLYCKRVDFRERLNATLRVAFEDVENEFETFISEILSQGMKAGLIPECPIEHLMIGLESTFEGAISMMWNNKVSYQNVENQEDYITVVSEFMLAGILGVKPK